MEFNTAKLLMLVTLAYYADATCTFPESWRGRWRMHTQVVDITEESWTVASELEATCLEQKNSYYLLKEEREGTPPCWKCLHITPRHTNILQYKASFCEPNPSTFNHLCYQKVDTYSVLTTMVRENGETVPCPFHGAFKFSYMNLSGECGDPMSSMTACAKTSMFEMNFKRCNGIPDSYERETHLHCLATWKDGDDYMYAKIVGDGFTDPNLQHRCFRYNKQMGSSNVKLAMSADATCYSMNDPSDLYMEEREFTLTRDPFKWPTSECSFPTWATKRAWKSLSGKHILKADEERQNFRVHLRTASGRRGDVQGLLRCVEKYQARNNDKMFTFVGYAVSGCTTQFQCIRLHKRSKHVLEVQKGRLYESKDHAVGECQDFQAIDTEILYVAPPNGSVCPFSGQFRGASSQCSALVKSTCTGRNQIQIQTKCGPHNAALGKDLTCLTSWSHRGSSYIIAKSKDSSSDAANCFVFRNHSNSLEFTTDRICNSDASHIFGIPLKYTLTPQAGSCVNYITKNTEPPPGPIKEENIDRIVYTKPDSHSDSNSSAGSQRHLLDSLVVISVLILSRLLICRR
ncbi:unnamed protein product [Owenia fusiformis]|uniref:Uncharacterized protein n=1 Tax=Owenia fusiformis TaxID=6347 RepID=A0A8S4MYZ5_OWEFU|nr:unnamed protein product [Owenia fusiformis]